LITRRDFLKGSMATLILIPLSSCSDDESPMDPGGNTNPGGCDGITSTGTNSGGHIHTLCVPNSDLTSPPASGATYTTSSDAAHTHSVTLTQAQLQSVAGGGTETVTSTGGTHTHDFLIEKA
jgi:hypothetical protein